MKKIIILLTLLLVFGCKENNDFDNFVSQISNYESYNELLSEEYYEVYLETSSIVKSLNYVNYPNFYTDAFDRYLFDNIIVVNKLHKVPADYLPNNLVVVENVPYVKRINETMYIDNTALENYKLMVEDAKKQGIELLLYSAYRSYEKQLSLWNSPPSFDNMYLAVPGHSEHHTGLALDISTSSDGLSKDKTTAYQYLEENAYKFGFILRYPENKESITGYAYEPWHYRYVGSIAVEIHEQNLTLEEYIYNYITI